MCRARQRGVSRHTRILSIAVANGMKGAGGGGGRSAGNSIKGTHIMGVCSSSASSPSIIAWGRWLLIPWHTAIRIMRAGSVVGGVKVACRTTGCIRWSLRRRGALRPLRWVVRGICIPCSRGVGVGIVAIGRRGKVGCCWVGLRLWRICCLAVRYVSRRRIVISVGRIPMPVEGVAVFLVLSIWFEEVSLASFTHIVIDSR